MKQLLTTFSLSEILLFVVVLAVAIKKLIDFIDWGKKRTRQAIQEKDFPLQLAKKHEQQLGAIKHELNVLKESIELLIESDKDDIKHSITKDHHYFCYKLGSIDDYSLDCIERRYSHYKDQGGNSFVEDLMKDLRALPRTLVKQNRV